MGMLGDPVKERLYRKAVTLADLRIAQLQQAGLGNYEEYDRVWRKWLRCYHQRVRLYRAWMATWRDC